MNCVKCGCQPENCECGQEHKNLPTAGYLLFIEDETSGNIAYKRAQTRKPDEHGDWQSDELVRRSDYRQKMMAHIEQLLDQAREYDEKGFGAFAGDCREMAYYIWTHILGEDKENFSHEYADLLDELTGAEWLKDLEKAGVEKKSDEVNE